MNRARVNYRANVPHEKKVKKKQKKMRLGLDFSDFLWYNTRMITKTQITSGTEAILDLSTPVFVGDVDQGQALVMDDDGGEHWVSLDRLDPVAPLPAPTKKELDDEAFWDMEREERMSDFWSFFAIRLTT